MTGRCSKCGRVVALTDAGKVVAHKAPRARNFCLGGGSDPRRAVPACPVCDGRGCEFCPAARRQELLDRIDATEQVPVWDAVRAEQGTVDVRLLATVAAILALALVVWLAWPYLVGATVIAAGWRVATRHTRRRRPRSSWSSLGRTAAMMYAAWNSRWLKGSTFKASVPARAGVGHACGECGTHLDDGTVPF